MKDILIEFAKQSGFIVEKINGEQLVCVDSQKGMDVRQELKNFAEMIIDECCDVVIRCDENPKLILCEPYRTIVNAITNTFGDDK